MILFEHSFVHWGSSTRVLYGFVDPRSKGVFPVIPFLHVSSVVRGYHVTKSEEQPTDEETGTESQKCVSPLHINTGGKNIFDEILAFSRHIFQMNVALAALGNDPLFISFQILQ